MKYSVIRGVPVVRALDEPTGELDPASSAAVFSLLSALNARGVTIVVAEQKLSLLAAHCKTLCVLDSGSIALQGDVREVLSQPRRLEALGLRVPRIAALHGRLAAAGLPAGPVPLTVSEAISMAKGVLA